MGYVSLTNNSPDARVHIRGASNRTVGQMIDVTKPLTGTFDILLSDNSTAYVINITALPNEATPNNSEFDRIVKTFAFVCRECGLRGRFHEIAAHSGLQHSVLHLNVDHIEQGEILKPLDNSAYWTTVITAPER